MNYLSKLPLDLNKELDRILYERNRKLVQDIFDSFSDIAFRLPGNVDAIEEFFDECQLKSNIISKQNASPLLHLNQTDVFNDQFVSAYSELIMDLVIEEAAYNGDDYISRGNYANAYGTINSLYKEHKHPERYIVYSYNGWRLERIS
jgi:hypothetical protein